MPILPPEPDQFPEDLLQEPGSREKPWWLLYTRSRQEKRLMQHLREAEIGHYGPTVPQRTRSPNGRIRVSYMPLFSTYVFMRGEDTERHTAVCSGRVLQASEIVDVNALIDDLLQIQSLIDLDVPLTIESRLEAGRQVRVKNGTFAGYEGVVIRRENEQRLLVAVRFMEQGVSVKLEDFQVEAVD